MNVCGVCTKERSRYLLNNKLVCLTCDELLFDIEIEMELEDQPAASNERSPLTPTVKAKTTSPEES